MDILIGADPEIFVRDAEGNLVSAYGMIEGTKDEPKKVKKGAVQVDGMALEFNIDPVKRPADFVDRVFLVMEQLEEMLPAGHTFAIQPTAEFGKEYLEAQPLIARDLGCNPDYNAYTGLANEKPNVEMPFRTASGHIHIGWTKDMDPFDPGHFEACRMITKQLDVILGVSSLLWDTDTKRRELYGKLGAFRPKPYGCEYRVLSNMWLTDRNLMWFVARNTQHAVNMLMDGNRYWEDQWGADAQWHFDHPNPYTIWNIYSQYTDRGTLQERRFFENLLNARVRGAQAIPQPVAGPVPKARPKARAVAGGLDHWVVAAAGGGGGAAVIPARNDQAILDVLNNVIDDLDGALEL